MGKKTENNSTGITLSPKKFKKQFNRLAPMILAEWKQLERDALIETGGDLDAVVEYIMQHTEQTRTLIQHHLSELYQLAKLKKSQKVESMQSDLQQFQDQMLPTVERTLDLLEKRAEAIVSKLEQDVFSDVKDRVREKPGTSLITAIGIGFLIGLIVGGSNRGR